MDSLFFLLFFFIFIGYWVSLTICTVRLVAIKFDVLYERELRIRTFLLLLFFISYAL